MDDLLFFIAILAVGRAFAKLKGKEKQDRRIGMNEALKQSESGKGTERNKSSIFPNTAQMGLNKINDLTNVYDQAGCEPDGRDGSKKPKLPECLADPDKPKKSELCFTYKEQVSEEMEKSPIYQDEAESENELCEQVRQGIIMQAILNRPTGRYRMK